MTGGRDAAGVRTLGIVAALAFARIAWADDTRAPEPDTDAEEKEKLDVSFGGYLQPQLRLRQDDDVAQADEDGFRVRRARVAALATRKLDGFEASAELEIEASPELTLLDAYVTAQACLGGGGRWRLDVGQVKAPVSRQALLSDGRLAFVEKPELAGLAPDRQIGARAAIDVPYLPRVRIAGGIFDGEGRNQAGNVDEQFLYTGRVEVRIGADAELAESAQGGDHAVAAASVARQRLDAGDGLEVVTTFGGDVAFAWQGLSGTVEYLEVRHGFVDQARPDYHANGIVAQLSYLLPVAALHRRLEIGARWEEIDRNDTIPIVRRGHPDQSLRYYTAALSWYQRAHALKLQFSASHIVEVEDRDAGGADATYANDTLLVQATFGLR